jgi:hypothetical protein
MARQLSYARRKALKTGITCSRKDFKWLCKNTNRVNMVGEGDSWFAYPRKNILIGKNANILDWVARSIRDKGSANLLRIPGNGDEAVEMLAGAQKRDLAETLRDGEDRIDLILFSGGGNDVVGKWDMDRLLNFFEGGFSASDCINSVRFKRKLLQIRLAYEELIELRDEYAPSAKIVTHTYDFLLPSKASARFAGINVTGPWIYPYLMEKNIPETFHRAVVRHLLTEMKLMLQDLAALNKNQGKFFVVNTQGTLEPGNSRDWKDEMHPTSSGFKKISQKYYGQLKKLEPDLPAFAR